MPRVRKSREELCNSFFVSVTEIARLFGCGRVMAEKCFSAAQKIDKEQMSINYLDSQKVRMASVLNVVGITEEELRKKVTAQ